MKGIVVRGAWFVFGFVMALTLFTDAGSAVPAPQPEREYVRLPEIPARALLGAQPPMPLSIPELGWLFPGRALPLWSESPPASASNNPHPWAVDGECMARFERFDWREYALAYPWPIEDAAYVVYAETGGTMDLCSVNRSSGATCWFQLLSGTDEGIQRGYLDPRACVEGAYRKWVDGGGSFQRHWFNHWTVTAASVEDSNGSGN